MSDHTYPIGVPGQPWGAAEKAAWRARQQKHRSYSDEVVSKIDALRGRFDVEQYGELDYGPDGRYPLLAIRSRDWGESLPTMLVTGGVHGYETSGVHGALQFVERHASDYAGRTNLLVVPCVSPWAYERINRWSPDALDPNRNFKAGSDKRRILRAQIYLADIADFDAMNRAWDAWVVPGEAPARATVQAPLARPGWKVEIVVTAAV